MSEEPRRRIDFFETKEEKAAAKAALKERENFFEVSDIVEEEEKTVFYICIMCPGVESDVAGNCPVCGMMLIGRVGQKEDYLSYKERLPEISKESPPRIELKIEPRAAPKVETKPEPKRDEKPEIGRTSLTKPKIEQKPSPAPELPKRPEPIERPPTPKELVEKSVPRAKPVEHPKPVLRARPTSPKIEEGKRILKKLIREIIEDRFRGKPPVGGATEPLEEKSVEQATTALGVSTGRKRALHEKPTGAVKKPKAPKKRPGAIPEFFPQGLSDHEAHVRVHPERDRLISGGLEHTPRSGRVSETFFIKFLVSLILTVPAVLYSEWFAEFFGWSAPVFYGSRLIPLLFGSAVFVYGGRIFLENALRELKTKLPGLMTLISMGISAAYLYSIAAFLVNVGSGVTQAAAGERDLFWETAVLISIMLFGHWLEMRAVERTQGILNSLSTLLPAEAALVMGGATEVVPLSNLKIGNMVSVEPGGRIPADGNVVEGRSLVDEKMLTGEIEAVPKGEGSGVIAGSVNGDGELMVEVVKLGSRTFLSGMMKLINGAQIEKSKIQVLADGSSFHLTIIAIVCGALTFVIWLASGSGIAFSFERLVAVLVAVSPSSIGLSVPLVVSLATTLAVRNGFLIKQRYAIENARKINTVLLEKTGTLTNGEYEIFKVLPVKLDQERKVLELAASVEGASRHFVARAIVRGALKRGLKLLPVEEFEEFPGKGVAGLVSGSRVLVGNELISEDLKLDPFKFRNEVGVFEREGKTVIFVIEDRLLIGVIVLADSIRDESKQVVRDLHNMGIKIRMLTGDSAGVAEWVARELDIDKCFARVLPQDKPRIVGELQRNGEIVAMVGDGVGEAPALARADFGIAIGAGTNINIESAGIILERNDPRDVVKIIQLSKDMRRKMVQNLTWAVLYNVIALLLAAGAFAAQGIVLGPVAAAMLMSLSTVIVAANAMTLRLKHE